MKIKNKVRFLSASLLLASSCTVYSHDSTECTPIETVKGGYFTLENGIPKKASSSDIFVSDVSGVGFNDKILCFSEVHGDDHPIIYERLKGKGYLFDGLASPGSLFYINGELGYLVVEHGKPFLKKATKNTTSVEAHIYNKGESTIISGYGQEFDNAYLGGNNFIHRSFKIKSNMKPPGDDINNHLVNFLKINKAKLIQSLFLVSAYMENGLNKDEAIENQCALDLTTSLTQSSSSPFCYAINKVFEVEDIKTASDVRQIIRDINADDNVSSYINSVIMAEAFANILLSDIATSVQEKDVIWQHFVHVILKKNPASLKDSFIEIFSPYYTIVGKLPNGLIDKSRIDIFKSRLTESIEMRNTKDVFLDGKAKLNFHNLNNIIFKSERPFDFDIAYQKRGKIITANYVDGVIFKNYPQTETHSIKKKISAEVKSIKQFGIGFDFISTKVSNESGVNFEVESSESQYLTKNGYSKLGYSYLMDFFKKNGTINRLMSQPFDIKVEVIRNKTESVKLDDYTDKMYIENIQSKKIKGKYISEKEFWFGA